MNHFLFKDRTGRTELPESFKQDLIPQNINTSGELDEYEESNIENGLVWLEYYHGDYIDWLFWNKLHKKLFGEVWSWAGQFRDRELANDDFDHPGYVQEHIKQLEGDLKYWIEKSKMSEQKIAAKFHERFLTIHPFNNGNGRTCRILTEYICERAKYPVPTWGRKMRKDNNVHRKTYIESVKKARNQKVYTDLIEFMYS